MPAVVSLSTPVSSMKMVPVPDAASVPVVKRKKNLSVPSFLFTWHSSVPGSVHTRLEPSKEGTPPWSSSRQPHPETEALEPKTSEAEWTSKSLRKSGLPLVLPAFETVNSNL